MCSTSLNKLNRRDRKKTYFVIKDSVLSACKKLRLSPPKFISGVIVFKSGLHYKKPKGEVHNIHISIMKWMDDLNSKTLIYHKKCLNTVVRFHRAS